MKNPSSVVGRAIISALACAASATMFTLPIQAQTCTSDVNGDGIVNAADLAEVLSNWDCQVNTTPTISLVTPDTGSTVGGTVFFINGTNLDDAVSVTVGGVAAPILFSNSSVIAATSPPSGSTGAKNIVISTPSGTAALRNAFTYNFYGVTPTWATLLEALPDPLVVTDAALRTAIIESGLPWRVRDTATQIEMLLVPGGSFTMGCTASSLVACRAAENPTHSVTLTNAFYIGRCEVTQAQWTAQMGSNPSFFQGVSNPGAPSRPVENVSWTTVQTFLLLTGMRLPSEAEWEYACRAGTTTAFGNGSSDDASVGSIAWYGGNNGAAGSPTYGTKTVGTKTANALGLHDMTGNVSELCSDGYSETYYASSPLTNPLGPASGPNSNRVLRGGHWNELSYALRSSARDDRGPTSPAAIIGFRVMRPPS